MSLFSSLSFLVRRTRKHFCRAVWKEGTDRCPDPGKPRLLGLQIQGSIRKPRLPGAAGPDKSFILYHAFRYELGYVKSRFISKLPCSPLSEPKVYLLGPKLVVVVAAKE